MKKLLAPLSASLLLAQPLLAQEKAAPAPAPAAAEPAAPEKPAAEKPAAPAADPLPASGASQKLELMPSKDPQLPAEPLPLIPDVPQPGEKPRGTALPDAPATQKRNKTDVAADELQDRIRFRTAKIKAESDPAIHEMWDRAHSLRTDYERREAMKAYFKTLYARIVKVDPGTKKTVELEQTRSLRRLEQTRIDATQAPESAVSDAALQSVVRE